MRKKFVSKIMVAVMTIAMAISLVGGSSVQAAEDTTETVIDSVMTSEVTSDIRETIELSYQEPVHITEFDDNNEIVPCREMRKIDLNELNAESFVMPMDESGSTVLQAGTVSDYLSSTNDYKLYNLSLPAGIYFQAQLTTPANAGLDYDLYFVDADGNILVGSDYTTKLNGTSGTLPEALGYITEETAVYYIMVHSARGGSVNEEFVLEYSISIACDSWEIDESVREALPFTFGTDGAYIDSRNLSSPVDNDWYVITVPSERTYDKLKITATTSSSNTCSVEIYQNIATAENTYAMSRVGSGGTVRVSEGTYYIRVYNAKSLTDFNDMDIQNYTLSIEPLLKADSVIITDLNGTEGMNRVVNYPGYGSHFRTGEGMVTVYGVAIATDSSTEKIYPVIGEQITGTFYSPAWDNNNTEDFAIRTGTGTTNSEGKFTVYIDLPTALGAHMFDVGTTYHYFDVSTIRAAISDDSSIYDIQTIFHFSHADYHPF